MNYKIISDSSSDIYTIDGCNYASVPLKIITSEKEYTDNSSLDTEMMISDLQAYRGKSKSACPNPEQWQNEFGDSDGIFCVSITSNLSGSCNSAQTALKLHTEKNPKVKGMVVDTLSTGPENAIIIEKLIELIEQKLPFDEIKKRIIEYMKSTHLLFALESLTNLANNGRVSKLSAKVAGVVGIRVVGKASDEGTLELLQKTRGTKKALEAIFDNMLKLGYKGGKVRIHHCLNEKSAGELKEKILSKFKNADIKIGRTGGLCSFYAEKGGLLVGYEA